MITLKSNIEFLTQFNKWRRSPKQVMWMPAPKDIGLNIEFAIDELRMHEQMIHDMASGVLVRRALLINPDDEKLFDSVANNGEAL